MGGERPNVLGKVAGAKILQRLECLWLELKYTAWFVALILLKASENNERLGSLVQTEHSELPYSPEAHWDADRSVWEPPAVDAPEAEKPSQLHREEKTAY